jgi:hypothetical protein
METKGKFIIQLTGPAIKYRLDILANACPEARHFLLCLTNRDSYDLYSEYHGFFNFIIMDDYRKDHPISLENEIFPNYKTEEEYFANIGSFYGYSTGNYYSYDIHRFIFPYLIENNILNFSFTDTDFILNKDPEVLNAFFERIPEKTCYGPWFGEDLQSMDLKKKFWLEEIQPNFDQIKLEAPFVRTIDGYMRGFHFDNLETMKLVYDLWNAAIDSIFKNPFYKSQLLGNNGKILHTEWVISHIMQFLEYQLSYSFVEGLALCNTPLGKMGSHITRVEDTIYLGPRAGWEHFGFDYSDTSTISNFIKKNKVQLHNYYIDKFPAFEITDTHVYTKI